MYIRITGNPQPEPSKERPKFGCTKEVFLTQVWSKHGPLEYSIYVAELNANAKAAGVPRNTCPHCRKPFNTEHMTEIDYTDPQHEDIGGWNFEHDCSATLLIIND
jgi:hypothetical protein